MKQLSKPAKATLLGFVAFVVGLAWAALHEYVAKQSDPPGWIMDREFYPPAAILARFGLFVFLIAGLYGVGRFIYHGISNRTRAE